jgi:16S rRNA processing protein RimM
LEITEPNGKEFLIPFVKALVPKVELSLGKIFIDPPGGLIDED